MVDPHRPTPEERRLSFGRGALAYDRYRPTYPAQAVEFVLGTAPLRVLDLGAGTGRLTQRLVELGHDVVAVEPDRQMLDVLRASNDVEAHAGTAEEIPLPDEAVDAVLVGQAFHWFDQGAALPEIARVLRPDGVLGLLWNLLDDRVGWVAKVCDITENDARVRRADDEPNPVLSPWFAQPQNRRFPHRRAGDLEDLLGEVATWSYVNLRADRDNVIAQVRQVVTEEHQEGSGFPYVTNTFQSVRHT